MQEELKLASVLTIFNSESVSTRTGVEVFSKLSPTPRHKSTLLPLAKTYPSSDRYNECSNPAVTCAMIIPSKAATLKGVLVEEHSSGSKPH